MDNLMLLAAVLTVAVIIVNGWTDAPNAISTVVASGCLSYKKAVLMAGVCNFLGLIIMWKISPKVSQNITDMLNICGKENIWIALIASFTSIIIFGVGAWCFGIPTSESHALIASILGVAVALNKINSNNINILCPAIVGLFLSVIVGFVGGYIISAIIKRIACYKQPNIMRTAQIISSALMAFMHGAQDGLKFTGLMIALSYSINSTISQTSAPLICSIIMMIGTFLGGKRIVDNLTQNMVKIDLSTGFSADIGSAIALLLCSIYGMPVSTTHTKTSAMVGSGFGMGKKVNKNTLKDILLAWIITFPVCFGISFVIIKLTLI